MSPIRRLLISTALVGLTALPAFAQQTGAGGGSSLATPVTPANGGSGVANTGNLTWNAAQTLSFTAGQTMTFPAVSVTLAGLGTAQTFSAANIFSAAGAASTPGLKVTGARFTGGSGTTTFPQTLLQESTATASTSWSTSGTALGINMHTASGNLFDFQVDGTSEFSGTAAGAFTIAGSMNVGNNIQMTNNSGAIFWASRSQFLTPADGRLRIENNAATIGIGLDFTGIPTVGGTATPSIATGSTDTAGEVTAGTSATSVTITFALAKTNAPFCTVTSQTPLASFAYTISTTVITITQTATTGNKIDYVCITRPN